MFDVNNGIPAPRVPLKVDVQFRRTYSRAPETGALRNISLTGAFLQCEKKELQINDKLALTINVSGRVRNVQALVVWANDRGCGVKFLPTNGQDTQIVDDLIGVIQETRTNKKRLLDSIFKHVA
jgi:hypothetical protein